MFRLPHLLRLFWLRLRDEFGVIITVEANKSAFIFEITSAATVVGQNIVDGVAEVLVFLVREFLILGTVTFEIGRASCRERVF